MALLWVPLLSRNFWQEALVTPYKGHSHCRRYKWIKSPYSSNCGKRKSHSQRILPDYLGMMLLNSSFGENSAFLQLTAGGQHNTWANLHPETLLTGS